MNNRERDSGNDALEGEDNVFGRLGVPLPLPPAAIPAANAPESARKIAHASPAAAIASQHAYKADVSAAAEWDVPRRWRDAGRAIRSCVPTPDARAEDLMRVAAAPARSAPSQVVLGKAVKRKTPQDYALLVAAFLTVFLAGVLAHKYVFAEPPAYWVRFVLDAPDAKTVSVSGDFNGWSENAHRMQLNPRSRKWEGWVLTTEGRYRYVFVVDGDTRIADPSVEERVSAGNGVTSSVVYVTPGAAK